MAKNKKLQVSMNPDLLKDGNKVLSAYGLTEQEGIVQFYEYLSETNQVPFPTTDKSGRYTNLPIINVDDYPE